MNCFFAVPVRETLKTSESLAVDPSRSPSGLLALSNKAGLSQNVSLKSPSYSKPYLADNVQRTSNFVRDKRGR